MTRWRSWLVLLAVAPSCSTLAPLPTPQECEGDDDCTLDGEVCATDTRICVPGGDLPPFADLGFDIQELVGGQVVFRTEVGGCDAELDRSNESRPAVRGTQLEQTFELVAFVDEPVDPEMPTVDELLTGAIELSQASRFARAPLAPPRVTYPALDESGEVATVLPTTFKWPRYHPYDAMPPVLEDGGFVLWRSLPVDAAPMLRMIVPPRTQENLPCETDTECCPEGTPCANFCLPGTGHCTAIGNPRFEFSYNYQDVCSRELEGEAVVIDGETLADHGPLVGVPLTIRHADTPSMPRLGVPAIDNLAPTCSDDSECIAGEQFCDPESGHCALALAGRQADSGSILTIEDGTFSALVYTYCDPDVNGGFQRSFTISTAPSGPLSALSYTFDTTIGPIAAGDQKPVARVPQRLCVPDWGASVPLSLQLVGEAVPLLGDGDAGFVCCDVGCLPGSPEDAANFEPTKLSTCDGRTAAVGALTATVSATLKLDAGQRIAWDAADCLPPDTNGIGVVGGIRRKMDCSGATSDATCVAPDLAAGKDGSPRDYELRLESPTGSLFTSQIRTIPVEASGAPQQIDLERRVLVRGRVLLDATTCDEAAPVDGDCGSEGALVRAERLRMPGESDATVVGPYFHELPTYFDPIAKRKGGFILPLDPGVYLLTALPLSGSRGGPSEITVLDLRDGKDVQRDLVLDSGVLVTLDLTGFDPRAQIVPLDRGSWRALVHPGRADDEDPNRRTVDLNAIGECLQPADEVPQACRIRRLVSGVSLSASQVGQVRFTARTDPGARCPG